MAPLVVDPCGYLKPHHPVGRCPVAYLNFHHSVGRCPREDPLAHQRRPADPARRALRSASIATFVGAPTEPGGSDFGDHQEKSRAVRTQNSGSDRASARPAIG